ncbi:MAG: hypothetical protein K2F81_05600 [Ruminococcus sp.]|nr:hypothetical protein [Ruminococcus sp.]
MKTTKNTKTTTTTTTATENRFALLLREYEQQARNRQQTPTAETEKAYTKALTDLATATAYSVLKKCIDVSQNKALIQVKQSIAKDTHALQQIEYANATAYETTYNADGEKVQRVKDKDSKQALDKLCAECLGDGLDLVNDAVIAIMTETAKAVDISADFMEMPYIVRRLKRKVWIKTADSVDGWETTETTPIQEVYKAVRRSIDSSRAMQTDPRNGYSYIEDYATDSESGAEERIYNRMPKYADLGGYATDFNGACTFYIVDAETVKDTDSIITNLNLTARQAKILQLRQSGHGYKAIATYLGIRADSVRDCMKAIQKKAVAIGLTPIK